MGRTATRDVGMFRSEEGHDQRDSLSSAEAPPPSRRSDWAGATRLALVLVLVGSAACTVPSQAQASQDVHVSRGPWINRTLIGGAARDLSIPELKAVNAARGISFPR